MTQDDESKTGQDEAEGRDEDGIFLPPLDLTSLILPFYTQALLKMGLIDDPQGGLGEENLDLAKRMIDLLELFKTKTAGNLGADEQKFLDSILHQLKMHYVDKAKIISL
jgi:hypothetical protein